MEYNTWNTKNIRKQMSQLRKNGSSLDREILEEIMNKDITPFLQEESFISRISEDRSIANEYAEFNKNINEFAKLKRVHKLNNALYLDEIGFSTGELLTFLNDFFSTKDNNWFNIFNDIYKERKNNLQFSGDRSYEIYIPSINYNYVNISKDDSIQDLFSIIHEYTHAIVDRLNYRYNYNEHYPFVELPSLLMEKIAKDEIVDTYIGVDKQVKTYMLASIRTLLNYANQIMIENEYFKYCSSLKNYNGTVNEMLRITHKDKEEIENLLNLSNMERLMYVIPDMVATELYYLYKVDPEKCFYILNILINLNNVNSYKKILNKYDINLNEHADEYIREIKRS